MLHVFQMAAIPIMYLMASPEDSLRSGALLAFRSWFSLIPCLAASCGLDTRGLDHFTVSLTALAGSLSLHDRLQTVVQVAHDLGLAHTKSRARGHINCPVFTDIGVLSSL